MAETLEIRNNSRVSRVNDQRKRREYQSALAQHLQRVRIVKSHASLAETDDFDLQGRRVLVVEDSYEQARELTDFLRSHRIKVVGPFPAQRRPSNIFSMTVSMLQCSTFF